MRVINFSRGDTIIEVMVAFAVFAMVAIGALTVMNKGTASAQNTLETTLVRQQIDNQAETLRFLHQAYLSKPDDMTAGSLSDKFRSIVTLAKTANLSQPSTYGAPCTQTIPVAATSRFALDPATGSMVSGILPANATSAPPYAQVKTIPTGPTAYGMWIEPVRSNATEANGTAQYIDFHVRACWNAVSSAPQRTLGTIVRLYVPENVATGSTGGDVTSIPLPPANEFTLAGSSASPCWGHRDVEREDAEGNPGFTPFDPNYIDQAAPGVWQCQRSGGSVYSCVNFDTQFSPSIPAESAGSYDLIIGYFDADCGPSPLVGPYSFKVAIYKNNALLGNYDFDVASSSRSIDIGAVDSTTKIQIRWWNNHFVPDWQDPDFGISQVIFKRKA